MANDNILLNNEDTDVIEGLYAFKATGALEVHVQFFSEGYDPVTDGTFTELTTGLIQLPRGSIKILNGGANSFIFKATKVDE